MHLKRLKGSNKYLGKELIKPIEFENGEINIILGSKGHEDKKGKTVNGVGKTLSLKLIDFCLGSNIDKRNKLKRLEGWEFELNIDIENKEYQIRRSIDESNIVYLNNIEYKLKDFNTWMQNNLLNFNEEISGLSYRNIISRYLRIPPEGYMEWEKCKKKEDDDISLLNNGFLLGLDPVIISNKIKIKESINEITKSKGFVNKDHEIKEILRGTDIGISITNLKKDIETLEIQIKGFKVAEGYNDIKHSIQEDVYLMQNIMNEIETNNNIIKNINQSLKIEIDITDNELVDLYEQANIVFPELIIKKLNDVSSFHEQLLQSRKNRLKEDKKKVQKEINVLKEKLKVISNRINENTELIKAGGSVDQLELLQQSLMDKKIKLDRMQQHGKLIKTLDDKITNLKRDLAEQHVLARLYRDSIQDHVEKMSTQFKEYVDYIYEQTRFAGIDVTNNTGDNKIQFEIKADIKDEDSAGVNNVRIFCMDLMYLTFSQNSQIDFIYHDNTLFAETDIRQIYMMFKLVKKICNDYNLQYIVNMNYEMYDNLLIEAKNDDKEFAKYLEGRVVLKLLDDSVENKLMGIEF